MPKYNSFMGMCLPAEEQVALVNTTEVVKKPDGKIENFEDNYIQGQDIQPGQSYIYKGPDRAATETLHKMGEKFMGMDFRRDTEFMQAVRNMGFNNTDEYLKWLGFDEKEVEKQFKELQKEINTHANPKPKKGTEFVGGGMDTSGSGQTATGAFGDPPGFGKT